MSANVEDVVVAEEVVEDEATESQDELKTDERIDWTTAPDQLRDAYNEVKTSYQSRLNERDIARGESEQLRSELDALRASQGQGVYFDTNVPLEDFSPVESLERMKIENPEYHDKFVSHVKAEVFWPSVGAEFKSFQGKKLSLEDPKESVVVEQMGEAWDFMVDRFTGGFLNSASLHGILTVVDRSPDIGPIIMRRLAMLKQRTDNGGDLNIDFSSDVIAPTTGDDSFSEQEMREVAIKYNLDLSETGHRDMIRNVLRERHVPSRPPLASVNNGLQDPRIVQYEGQIHELREQLDKIANERVAQQSISEAEISQRAEARLEDVLKASMDKDIQDNYAAAIPLDKPGMRDNLMALTSARLAAHPDYLKSKETAVKWFRQAVSARDPLSRDKWDAKGLDALALAARTRSVVLKSVAEEILKPLSTSPSRPAARKTVIPGGKASPANSDVSPAPIGDIESAKAAIRQRARQSGLI